MGPTARATVGSEFYYPYQRCFEFFWDQLLCDRFLVAVMLFYSRD